jgi:predicted DNA-binding transcriptional regulator YafY
VRLISLLMQLQLRGRLSGSQLAERLEVSERTVQRDVEALVEAGVPIRSERGPGGGYRLDGRYQTRLNGLAAEEAQALAFLGLEGPAGALGLAAPLDAARSKVWTALTTEARERAERARERFHLDPVRWYGTAEPVPLLGLLAEAVWGDRRIRASYARDGRAVERELDPLGLVLAAGDWYLVAGCGSSVRIYRVSRIVAADVLDEPAERPAGFRLSDSWARAREELESSHPLLEVTVRVANEALPRLRRSVAVAGQARVPVATSAPFVELTVPFEGERWALTCLLGLGPQVEVLAPASLRRTIAEEIARSAALYAAG